MKFYGVYVHGAADPDLIETACKKTVTRFQGKVDYSFCVSSLKVDPKSKTYGIYDLGVESYNLASKKGVSIESHIHKLLKNGKQSPAVMERLRGCSQDYAGIGRLMEVDATGSFELGDYPTAVLYLAIASSSVQERCHDRFDGGFTSPLTKEENEFSQHLYISDQITEMTMAVSPPL
ncbi:hypothetical protein MKX03_000589 [Papaver bracteatum]|nr:hypothetical protein MKX03_000589 [Papaver bracteatum]